MLEQCPHKVTIGFELCDSLCQSFYRSSTLHVVTTSKAGKVMDQGLFSMLIDCIEVCSDVTLYSISSSMHVAF